MRLILRLTHDHSMALTFASAGGVRRLLQMNGRSGFNCFHSLATMILRNVVEDDPTLRHTMEKAIRASMGPTATHSNKDFHCLLRSLSGVACRHPQIFEELMDKIVEVDIPLTEKKGFDASRLFVRAASPGGPAHGSSGSANKSECFTPLPQLSQVGAQVISDVMEFLAIKPPGASCDEKIIKKSSERPSAGGSNGSSVGANEPITGLSSSSSGTELSRFAPSILRVTRPMDLLRHPSMPMSLEMEVFSFGSSGPLSDMSSDPPMPIPQRFSDSPYVLSCFFSQRL